MARVLVVGAGAVGGYYGACLSRAGHDVTFVVRPGKRRSLDRGIRVTGAMGEFSVPGPQAGISVTDDPAESQGDDLVLLCVKAYDLPDAAASLDGSAGTVVTLQNGVDAPDVARRVLGDVVLAGSTGIVADLVEPGHVHCVSDYAWIAFGEPDGSPPTDRVRQIEAWLDVEGVQVRVADDARVALWEKMALMCGMAGFTTLLQRPIGEVLTDHRYRFEAVVAECEAVARAQGVPLPDDFAEDRMRYADAIDPAAMSSMSRDFARGKPIELDTFNGAVVRLGAELGVDVPENARVADAISEALATRDAAGAG